MYVIKKKLDGRYLQFVYGWTVPSDTYDLDQATRFDSMGRVLKAIFKWGQSIGFVKVDPDPKYDVIEVEYCPQPQPPLREVRVL